MTRAETRDLSGTVALITGANTGIGKVAAERLAERGARVVLACRSQERTEPVLRAIRSAHGEEAAGFVPLDLSSLASVRRCVDELLARDERYDLLINNAGLAGARGTTEEGFEMAFGVNHLGHFAFTLPLLPKIGSDDGKARIVNVSSKAHYDARTIDFDRLRSSASSVTGLPEYAVSKLANVLFTRELRHRLDEDDRIAVSLHPGVVATDVWRRIPGPIARLMKLFMIDPDEGAQTTLHCATDPSVAEDPALYYDACRPKEPNAAVFDDSLARELWNRSLEWTGLEDLPARAA